MWRLPAAMALAAMVVTVFSPVRSWSQAAIRPAASGTAVQPWGEPDLTGVWRASVGAATPRKDTLNLARLERLYNAEARGRIQQLSVKDDPAQRCLPPAFPRAALLGPIQIVQRPGVVVVLTEAFHTFRLIPTDGRNHPTDMLYPMYLGDSSGRWTGDTLTVDVISFNGEGWLANPDDKPSPSSRGVWPSSDALHVTERWRRVAADRLAYQATVEDPAMLSAPWQTPTIVFTRQADRIDVRKCFVDDPATRPAAVAQR